MLGKGKLIMHWEIIIFIISRTEVIAENNKCE